MRCSASHSSTSETRWTGDRETPKSGGTSSKDDGRIPNNPKLPLLVYPGALSVSDDLPSECEVLFGENGWGGAWRGRVFTYHHYHSTVHEVLGIVRGTARLAFGGESGVALELETGDVAVIPAGAGQCNSDSGEGFLVDGSYPRGQSWDLRTGEPGGRPEVLENIRRVTLSGVDPVFGNEGPVITHWIGLLLLVLTPKIIL